MTQVAAPRAARSLASPPRTTFVDRFNEIEVLDVAAVALVALGVGLWLTSLGSINPAASSDYGLVGQLPPVWWLSVTVVLLALAVGSRPSPVARWTTTAVLTIGTGAFALVLHGTASAAEQHGRFPTAYVHAGFAQYIAQYGQTLPHLDLRMSWAGFFAATAVASRAMGVSPTWFIKWSPLVLNLAYLLPLKVIADANLRSTRARWAALWLFLAANWVGQDYFSPQGMNLFLYLSVVAVMCRAFGASGPASAPARRLVATRVVARPLGFVTRVLRIPTETHPGEAAQLDLSGRTRLLLFGLTAFVIFASISSHQFTPLMIAIMAAVLVVIGRTRLTALWVLTAVGVAAWTSFLAVTYWSGHLAGIFGGVGNVGGTLNQNVTVRLHGSSARLLVLDARIAFALMIWAAAGFAFVRALRRGRSHWTLLVLIGCPVLILAGQSYGGEGVLRVFLFSLPPAAILIASLLDDAPRDPSPSSPSRTSRVRLAPLVWVATLIVSVALFPIARWGNEPFEAVSTGDLAAIQWVYANVAPGATLVAANGSVPWRYDHIADYRYVYSTGLLFDLAPDDIHDALSRTGHDTYLVLTRDQANSGVLLYGTPRDWLEQITDALGGNSQFRIMYQNPDAIVVHVLNKGTA